jgi:hypothetical protein
MATGIIFLVAIFLTIRKRQMETIDTILFMIKNQAKIHCLNKRCMKCGGSLIGTRVLAGFSAFAVGTKDKFSLNRFKDSKFPENIRNAPMRVVLTSNKLRIAAEEFAIEIVCIKCFHRKYLEIDLNIFKGYDIIQILTAEQRDALQLD